MLERFERFSLAIFESNRCWHKLAAGALEKYELSSSHAMYLHVLHRCGEGITAARLGELCCRDKADVSRMVCVMEKKGLVRRETTGKNLYRAKLVLTEDGKRVAEHVQERAALAVELAGGDMTEGEREIFYRCLERITEKLQMLSKEGQTQG